MGQWGKPFKFKGLQFLPHFDTGHPFNPITNTSIIDKLILIDRLQSSPDPLESELEELERTLLGKTSEEYEQFLIPELKLNH